MRIKKIIKVFRKVCCPFSCISRWPKTKCEIQNSLFTFFKEIQPVCFFFSQIVTLKKRKKKQTCKFYNLFDGLKYLLFEIVLIWLKASDKVKLFRLPWKFTKRNQCHGKNCLEIFVSLMSLVIDGRKSWKKLKSVLLYYLVLTTAQYEIFGFMMHCEKM